MAVSWVYAAMGPDKAAEVGARLDPRYESVLAILESSNPGPLTSSVGRLFDAVAALIGLRSVATYEGQAAIELEALAIVAPNVPVYPIEGATTSDITAFDPNSMLAVIVNELGRGTDPSIIAAGFHNALALATSGVATSLARAGGLEAVALSGGVFQNSRFRELVADKLLGDGLSTFAPAAVPANDGGISLGQVAIASGIGVGR